MVMTFDSTGDDISDAASTSLAGPDTVQLVYGWCIPTALTAGRALFGMTSTVTSLRVDTTTSELRAIFNATTDSIHISSGAGITVGEWKHVAWLSTATDTGPAVAHRLWIGGPDKIPVEVPMTLNTSPTGTFSGGATVTYGNNTSTTSIAWEGSMQDFGYIAQFGGTPGLDRGFPLAAYGAITDAEADYVYRQFVLPLWGGDFHLHDRLRDGLTNLEHLHYSGDFVGFRAWGCLSNDNLGSTLSQSPMSSNSATENVDLRRAKAVNLAAYERPLVVNRRI